MPTPLGVAGAWRARRLNMLRASLDRSPSDHTGPPALPNLPPRMTHIGRTAADVAAAAAAAVSPSSTRRSSSSCSRRAACPERSRGSCGVSWGRGAGAINNLGAGGTGGGSRVAAHRQRLSLARERLAASPQLRLQRVARAPQLGDLGVLETQDFQRFARAELVLCPLARGVRPARKGMPLRRRGCPNRWQPLANGEHGASMTAVSLTARARRPPAPPRAPLAAAARCLPRPPSTPPPPPGQREQGRGWWCSGCGWQEGDWPGARSSPSPQDLLRAVPPLPSRCAAGLRHRPWRACAHPPPRVSTLYNLPAPPRRKANGLPQTHRCARTHSRAPAPPPWLRTRVAPRPRHRRRRRGRGWKRRWPRRSVALVGGPRARHDPRDHSHRCGCHGRRPRGLHGWVWRRQRPRPQPQPQRGLMRHSHATEPPQTAAPTPQPQRSGLHPPVVAVQERQKLLCLRLRLRLLRW
jgi:hypothetical protein